MWLVFIPIFLAFSLVGWVFISRPVRAQTGTLLSVQPPETTLLLNSQSGVYDVDVQIVVSDVLNLTAFDLTITYNPDHVTLTGWSLGTFLKNLHCVVNSQSPGIFRRACTQLASDGVDGTGVLLNLNFTANIPGETAITIENGTLTNKIPQFIPLDIQHGAVSVGYLSVGVSSRLSLQGRASPAGIPTSLGIGATYGQGPFSALSAATVGQNLDLGAVVGNDAYTLTVSYPGYLGVATNLAVPVGDDLTLPPLRLLAGDVNADDLVDAVDLEAIGVAFDASGSGLAADLNGDGVVNLQDLALAAGNYGLTPAEAYGDWLP
jgi:hypothetical protein